MNQVSPYITGAATITVTQLEPLVSWGLAGFHGPAPAAVPGVIAAIILTLAHAICNRLAPPKQ